MADSFVGMEGGMRWTAVSLATALVCATVNQAVAQKNVALVIGNDEYAHQTPLQNPGRDAQLIGATLQKIGFKLVENRALINLDKVETDKMVRAFAIMAQDAEIALFYFSGHGMQVSGKNYLVPIDLENFSPATVDFQTLNADLVLAAMEKSKARVKIMLLDACRTNPFIVHKDQGGGLALRKAPAGTVIGFATQPDNTASQGPVGGLSPYAKALGTYMSVKDLELFTLLNETGLAVMAATDKLQQPWISFSPIFGRIILNRSEAPPALAERIPPTPEVLGRTHPEAPPPSSVTGGASLDLIQRAYTQLDKNDYPGARATLTQAIELDRNFAPAYSYRGFAWYLEGLTKDPRNALEAYRQGFSDLDIAIRLDPSYAPVRRHRGNTIVATYKVLRALGQPTNDILDRAIDDLKDAVELDPTSKTNANALGEAYRVKWNQRDAQVHKQVQVIEDLQLREQPDPRTGNILGKMPQGSQVAVTDTCRTWWGSGRGAQDADNIWCPVLYAGRRGWANAYYLADHGERVACVLYPPAGGCASKEGRLVAR
jgi:tetratricopeptide (TPR) repeat protein